MYYEGKVEDAIYGKLPEEEVCCTWLCIQRHCLSVP